MDIELPWPARQLSPNFRSRSHWPRTNAIKKARELAHLATLEECNTEVFDADFGKNTIPILLTFYPPTAHKRDRDNLLASCKAYLDGVAQACGVNDSAFDPRAQIAEPVKNGRVVITLPNTEDA